MREIDCKKPFLAEAITGCRWCKDYPDPFAAETDDRDEQARLWSGMERLVGELRMGQGVGQREEADCVKVRSQEEVRNERSGL